MQEKKSLFEVLDPKSALILGLVGGLLTLGTLGFIVTGSLALKGGLNCSAESTTYAMNNSATPAPVAQPNGNTPAPAAPVVPKTNKPKVELFVMSYCPYGLQMQKAYLPALDLLKNKADIDVKFVSYAMHGEKEVTENTRQYCIQGEQGSKYSAYLSCFVAGASADSAACLASAKVDQKKLSTCMAKIDQKFGITAKFNDKASWLSGQFPIYPIHQDLNDKYGVQGSPTLVINGVQAEVNRTPEAIKQAICNAFNKAPAECGTVLSNQPYQAGFGLAAAANSAGAAGADCGV